MVEPAIRFCEWHLVKRDAFEHCRIRAPDALRVWKILG